MITTIYRKVKKSLTKKTSFFLLLSSLFFSVASLTSCVDTVLLPDDKTVEEDYWKTKSEVSAMVAGAYQAMTSSDIMQRLIVWGDYRSDELVKETNVSNTALSEIEAMSIQTTNTFATWAAFYNVINDCNVVLEKSGNVMNIDPSFTEGDYQTFRSQMLALRSLCYFYLVRNFRDVPYITKAYVNSSQPMDVSQTAPDSVLQGCIDDLLEAEQNALDPQAYTNWKRTGYINREAIDAMLADIYLWRASVKHSADDYQQCVTYCDKVIASKQANHQQGVNELEVKEYPLADGDKAFEDLFVTQNAEESIFELQFDGSNNSNTGLCQMYHKYDKGFNLGYLKASSILGLNSTIYVNNNNATNTDYRFKDNTYGAGSSNGNYTVRKFVAEQAFMENGGDPSSQTGKENAYSRAYDNYAQNYIFYRLSDVMLMKAEALTALAATNDDIQLRQAFNLVQAVNTRSLYNKGDSLKWQYYNTQIRMEDLVLNERLRELSFEGKRWYDLMRYNYRHITASDYSKTFYQLEQEGVDFPRNYDAMLNLVTRKYTSGGSAIAAKMRYETMLYMPINNSDITVNYNLHQNPAYSDEDEYVKN